MLRLRSHLLLTACLALCALFAWPGMGRVDAGGPPPADLVISVLTAPASAFPGQSLSISETTLNQGAGVAAASSTRICLARDAALTDQVSHTDLAHVSLIPGGSESKSGQVSIPVSLTPGTYYVGAIADQGAAVSESNETNNNSSKTIEISGAPDLVVSALSAPDFVLQGDSITVTETTENAGSEAAGASSTRICVAHDANLSNRVVTKDLSHAALAEGASEELSDTLDIPLDLPSGYYYVGAVADVGGAVTEGAEDNNKRTQQIIIGGVPDLVVSSLSAPVNASPGQSIPVTVTTRNSGPAACGAFSTRVCLARNMTLTDVIAYSDLAYSGLDGGESEEQTGAVVAPDDLTPGTYYVGAIADSGAAVPEDNESNNKSSSPISIIEARWVAAWHFDEGSGTTAYDSAGSANGTFVSSGPLWTTTRAPNTAEGYALSFDGADDRVATADINLTGTMLVRAWVNPGSATGYPQVIVGKFQPGIAGNYELGLRPDLKPYFSVGLGAGTGTEYRVTSSTALTAGTWHCLAGTYDGSTIRLYVDTLTPNSWPAAGTITQNDLSTTIGRSAALGSETTLRAFRGVIDEVFIGDTLTTFPDVPPTYWAADTIEACSASGIIQGYDTGRYEPTWEVSRSQMAVYIARAVAGGNDNVPPATAYPTPSFTDVPKTYWAYRYIEYAVEEDIVQGYAGGIYQPEVPLDRGQMAVYIARSRGWVTIGDDMTTAPELFPDVPAGFWAGTAVEACVGNAVVRGYTDGYYYPGTIVTRDQMAVYIAKAFELPM